MGFRYINRIKTKSKGPKTVVSYLQCTLKPTHRLILADQRMPPAHRTLWCFFFSHISLSPHLLFIFEEYKKSIIFFFFFFLKNAIIASCKLQNY